MILWWMIGTHKVLFWKNFGGAPKPATRPFGGSKFEKWAQNENFRLQVGARKVLAPKKHFSGGSEMKNLTLYIKKLGWGETFRALQDRFCPKGGKMAIF